jgi:hypothetical protein
MHGTVPHCGLLALIAFYYVLGLMGISSRVYWLLPGSDWMSAVHTIFVVFPYRPIEGVMANSWPMAFFGLGLEIPAPPSLLRRYWVCLGSLVAALAMHRNIMMVTFNAHVEATASPASSGLLFTVLSMNNLCSRSTSRDLHTRSQAPAQGIIKSSMGL